jgi:hypothetical protein
LLDHDRYRVACHQSLRGWPADRRRRRARLAGGSSYRSIRSRSSPLPQSDLELHGASINMSSFGWLILSLSTQVAGGFGLAPVRHSNFTAIRALLEICPWVAERERDDQRIPKYRRDGHRGARPSTTPCMLTHAIAIAGLIRASGKIRPGGAFGIRLRIRQLRAESILLIVGTWELAVSNAQGTARPDLSTQIAIV